MSERVQGPLKEVERVREKLTEVKRSLMARIGRGMMWTVLAVVLLIAALFGTFAWYSTTSDFERRVARELVSVLEDATGGRVELKAVHFNLWKLSVEADGLVIHGLEGPGEAPYFSADRVLLRVKLFNFFTHVTGSGLASHVSLNYLRVEHPQMHLIVDKDGKTNQPAPKHPRTSSTPMTDTLLDLKARQVELADGVVSFNDHAIPFDLAARDLNAEIHYIFASDSYGATVDLNDLRTKLGKEGEAQSKVHLEAELGRDAVELKKLDLHTGTDSEIHATGTLTHFAKPDWKVEAKGTLDLKQVAVLTGVDGLKTGAVNVDVTGHNCGVTPAETKKRPRFWESLRSGTKTKPGTTVALPASQCEAGYLIEGSAKVRNAGYRDEFVRLHDVNGSGKVHITPSELLLTQLVGDLPDGGRAEGELRIVNPSAEGATAPPQQQNAHAYLTATLTKVPLRTIMDVTAPENYGDLGFDTAVSGPVKVEWGGPAKDIADTVEVDGNLTMAPTGVKRKGALSDIRVTGDVLAHYTGKDETVRIQRMTAHTPQSNMVASGVLGVNTGDRLTALNVNLSVRDLSEYDQLLTTLGLEGNGKKGAAAIPVSVHGLLDFDGTASGPIRDLDVKGHVEGSQIEFAMGSTDALIDSLVADAEYAPNEGVAVANSTIKRGSAVLKASGTVKPRKVVSRRGVASYVWDEDLTFDANVQLADGSVTDVLKITGQQQNVPVTGTIAANAHVTGTANEMTGSGHISLVNGVAYGEPYESAAADLSIQGKDIEARHVLLKLHGMKAAGDGGYDMTSERLHGHIEGHDLVLSKFETVKRANINADGTLSVVADANGTLTEPGLKANVRLVKATYQGQPIGEATAELHSTGKTLYATVNSTLVGANVDLAGQTQLTGNYETQAKLTVANLDINKPLAIFAPGQMSAQSTINGTATLSGPLKTPKALSGAAEFNVADVKLEGIELKAAEPLRVSLRDGIATLEQVHITGQDTDMRMNGTAQLIGATDPRGGKLNIKSSGSVSMSLLHTFDADFTSSGKVEFSVAAGGQVKNPTLSGKVQFDNVNVAFDGVPNGLSNMNGTLVLNEERLEVQTLTARTGGGDLKLGGSIRYRNGIFADLTATGSAVRVRLYGFSATANANLRLQGTPQSSLLSGNILLTRFGMGQDVDIAAFGSAGSVSTPPDPNAPLNRVRLDVRVKSSPQLDFQNTYAKLAGTVDLTLRGTVAVPSVLGRIQITEGSATFSGVKYQLQRGDIYFTNPVLIDPTIDLDATAQVENYQVTVGLHGTSRSLKPTYRSEPPLSEADVFALLALGRTQEEAQLYQERQLQTGTDPTTSALLGGALNATVSTRVEKLFGVGSVKIDPAFVGTLGNSSARITVQEQLSKQITATFATNVNTSAQQLIQVQYDLSHDNSIVVTRDESGVFSIVYKVRRRYR
ncbi:translocation/assembly module TamB domain-containing protein [Edaphobacter bradus]|uniref:translocation/assembly module TamB domain-containing protein n=1 Tax=Edaphobacter bradus TaxID=2259016 RepID=UPI0021DFFCC0|nr:translocation/assembly module TamB domain-containing protein [Edaphobacter bradus]